ncbi:MAG: hypothetical protein HY513_05820 [Candidatus Aenigmarchaeota archaeon]|nr:hypothetical protein [Candidatus Aenigmarchaeota archaeon]
MASIYSTASNACCEAERSLRGAGYRRPKSAKSGKYGAAFYATEDVRQLEIHAEDGSVVFVKIEVFRPLEKK